MTRPLLRTLLYSAASGAGLWAVAAGLLTHHLTASKIGAAVAVVGALLVFTGPAEASNFDGWPVQVAAFHVPVQLPPRAYQHPSTFMVSTVPSSQIAAACDRLGATHADAACERDGVAYMPNPCDFPRDDYARLLCHEQGHASGWGPNHPTENDR